MTETSLPRLHAAMARAPPLQTPQTRVLTTLSRVSSVRIRDSVREADGNWFYVIDIAFTQPLRGLATRSSTIVAGVTSMLSAARSGRPSDVRTRRRFSEFANLHHELYFHVHAPHRQRKAACEFCVGVRSYLARSAAMPSLLQLWFSSHEAMGQRLEIFLNAVLQVALTARRHRERLCEGHEMVPLLVEQFLLGGSEDTPASEVDRGRDRPT